MTKITDFSYVGLLILAVILSWVLPIRMQTGGIAICMIVFLILVSPISLGILLVSSVIIYYLVNVGDTKSSVFISLIAGIAAILFYFKLYAAISTRMVILPIGISYYSFRQIHYIFEKYKKTISGDKFYDFMSYMFFFPTLLVGPISRYDRFLRDVNRRRWDTAKFSEGLERILIGYFKVIFLGDFLFTKIFHTLELKVIQYKLLAIYLRAIGDWINLYMIFSGYSDVAIGFGLLCGFTVMENFNFPFLSTNVIDYWSRWHISLSNWVRDYVYYPIASKTKRHMLGIFIAMIIIGVWHEFTLQFLLWGIYHSIGIVYGHSISRLKLETKIKAYNISVLRYGYTFVSILLTISFVSLSFPITEYLSDRIIGFLG